LRTSKNTLHPSKTDLEASLNRKARQSRTQVVGYILILALVSLNLGQVALGQVVSEHGQDEQTHNRPIAFAQHSTPYSTYPASQNLTRQGIGVLAGPTSGATFKWTRSDRSGLPAISSVDVNLSLNLEGFLLVTSHVLRETKLPESAMVFFLGSGMASGTEDGHLFWGVSTNIGGYFVLSRYEVFLQLMPRLTVLPERKGRFGASVGLRYLF